MDKEWRNGRYTEYAKFLIVNVFVLVEEVLCRKMGDSVAQSLYIGYNDY